MQSFKERAIIYYKYAVAVDILFEPTRSSIHVIYYYAYLSMSNLLYDKCESVGLKIKGTEFITDILDKYSDYMDEVTLNFVSQIASVLESSLGNPNNIQPIDVVVKDMLMCELHSYMNAHSVKDFDSDKDRLIGAGVYRNGEFEYDLICIDKGGEQ